MERTRRLGAQVKKGREKRSSQYFDARRDTRIVSLSVEKGFTFTDAVSSACLGWRWSLWASMESETTPRDAIRFNARLLKASRKIGAKCAAVDFMI
jgi:hypothetical protein